MAPNAATALVTVDLSALLLLLLRPRGGALAGEAVAGDEDVAEPARPVSPAQHQAEGRAAMAMGSAPARL